MPMIPTPEGISEADYDAIAAAVMETVRGRWFLAEFERRSRAEEMRQMLEAIARLEQTVRDQQPMPADPSIRLLVQRLKEVSQTLDRLASEMRARSIDEKFCASVETQSRAVAGLLRVNPAPAGAAPSGAPRIAAQNNPPSPAPAPSTHEEQLAALARVDQLPDADKLKIFA